MLRRDADEGEAAAAKVKTTRPCASATKIRKRCALSPSSSPSPSSGKSGPLRRLRLRRGVVVLRRRRGGAASPGQLSRRMSESSWKNRRSCLAADGTHSSASARKLVSSLWQMNEGVLVDDEAVAARDAAAARRGSAHRRCASSVEISKRSTTKNKVLDGDDEWFSDMRSNGGTMETRDMMSWTCLSSEDRMAHLQDMYNSLGASKELVRVLGSILGRGEMNPSTASLLSALRSELDLARAHARQLVREQRRHGDEVELLRRRLAAEAHEWKCKQREKVAATVKVVAAELDGERRSRRRAERVNAKLGQALAEAEGSLQAAAREVERERRSRERLEKVCDELVRSGGGASGAEAEEMRREAERAQEELGKEREMLRLADELREERVQMKLLEARLQFEEKNAVVEQLRGELEAFLETKKDHRESPAAAADDDDEHRAINDHQLQLHLLAPYPTDGAHGNGIGIARVGEGDEDDDEEGGGADDDSEGSDMHSIELNMNGGNSKDCGWSYAAASKEMTTTSSSSKKASDRGTEDCGADPWTGAVFDQRWPEESEGGHWDDDDDDDGVEGRSDRTSRDLDEESERYEAIKNLREQMLAGHGFVFLSQPDGGGGNAESEQHRYGLMC